VHAAWDGCACSHAGRVASLLHAGMGKVGTNSAYKPSVCTPADVSSLDKAGTAASLIIPCLLAIWLLCPGQDLHVPMACPTRACRAVQHGAKLTHYYVWTWMDNWEWRDVSRSSRAHGVVGQGKEVLQSMYVSCQCRGGRTTSANTHCLVRKIVMGTAPALISAGLHQQVGHYVDRLQQP
jgi:hypothetical protein